MPPPKGMLESLIIVPMGVVIVRLTNTGDVAYTIDGGMWLDGVFSDLVTIVSAVVAGPLMVEIDQQAPPPRPTRRGPTTAARFTTIPAVKE